MQLLNAFSLQMLDLSDGANVSFEPADVWKDGFTGMYVYTDPVTYEHKPLCSLDSKLGHEDIANILGCKMNRVNSKLEHGERALIAQVMGGRLPEGVTTIPKGYRIEFYWVKVN